VDAEGDGLADQGQRARRRTVGCREQIRRVDQVPEVHRQLRARAAERVMARSVALTASRVRYIDTPSRRRSWHCLLEARRQKTFLERLRLEVDLDATDVARRELARVACEDARLPAARGREVDLEHRPAASAVANRRRACRTRPRG
jgi:hypothetical protein